VPFQSTVTIEELTGDRRMLVLAGSALPKKGVPFGLKLKVVTKFPVGNTNATEHVLGPEELPSEWAGVWRSTQLARNPVRVRQDGGETSTTRAVEVARIFEDFIRSAQRLRVTWTQNVYALGEQTGSEQITRRGFCTSFVPSYEQMDDVEWTASWAWGDRGEPNAGPVTVKNDDLGSVVQNALQQLRALQTLIETNAIKTATDAAAGSPSTFSLGNLESLANAPKEFFNSIFNATNLAISGITQIADLAATIVLAPADVAAGAIDVAERAASSLVNICETFTRTIPDAYASVADRPGLLIAIVSYFDDVEEQTETASSACTELATTMRAQVTRHLSTQVNPNTKAGDVAGVFIPKQGQTFTNISFVFFGTGDYGGDIAFSNGFESYDVEPPPGTVLVIPTLKTIQANQAKF
jgi:hypothetical protein